MNRRFKLLRPLMMVVVALAGRSLAAPGDLMSFTTTEVDRSVNAIAVQPDGKVLIAGNFSSVNGGAQVRVARLSADGTRETAPTFVDRNINDNVNAMGLQADGKIIIVGRFTTITPTAGVATTANRIARLNSDGSHDTTFTGGLDGTGYAVAVLPSGKIWVGGDFGLVSFSATGVRTTSADSVRSETGTGKVFALAVQPDGKIVIAGKFSHIGTTARRNIARLNADGTLDTTFKADTDNNQDTDGTGPRVATSVFSLCVRPDGRILVGGYFVSINGVSKKYFARLTPTGAVDKTFIAQVNSGVMAIAVDSAGEIIIGGEFSNVNGFNRFKLAKLDGLGRVYTNFSQFATSAATMQNGTGTAATAVYSLAQTATGSILVGGIFETLNGGRKRLAKVENGPAGSPSFGALVDEGSDEVAYFFFPGNGTYPVVDAVDFLDNTGAVIGTSEGTGRRVFQGVGETEGSPPVWKLRLSGQTSAVVGGTVTFRLRMHQLQNSSVYTVADQTVTLSQMPAAGFTTTTSSIAEDADSSSNKLILTVALSSTFSSDKKLKIELGGNATNGLDYTPLETEVVIPAGFQQQSVAVLQVKDDFLIDGDSNTVQVQLVDPAADPSGLTVLSPLHTLTITENDAAPQITGDPQSGLYLTGTPVTLSAAFTSGSPPKLQWLKNGKPIPGATQASLSFASLKLEHAGAYQLVVTNSVKGVSDVSLAANITVVEPSGGSYVKKAGASESITFTTKVRSPSPINIVWKKGSTTIPGAEFTSYTLSNLGTTNSGDYECFVSSGALGPLSAGIHRLNVVDGAPVLLDNFALPDGRVATAYDQPLPLGTDAAKAATSATVSGLPPGLRFDPVSLRVTGRPTKPGSQLPVVITASNPAGSIRRSGTISILHLPTTALGQFVAALEPVDAQDLGGRADFVTSTTGSISGSFVVQGVRRTFSGRVNGGATNSDPVAVTLLPLTSFGGDPSPSITIAFGNDNRVQFFLNHTLLGRSGVGWRNIWTGGSTSRAGRHNFGGVSTNVSAPPGGVAGSFEVSDTGVVTIEGTLGDGTSLTGSSVLGPLGEVFVYQPLYSKKGFIRSPAVSAPFIAEGNTATVSGQIDWFKAQTNTVNYPAGFATALAPAPLALEGNRYTAPTGTNLIMDLSAGPGNLKIAISEAELAAADLTGTVAIVSGHQKINSITETATIKGAKVSVVPATGKFTGSFNVPDNGIDPLRTANFSGWFWSSSGIGEGYGNFMLTKSLASGNASPRVSGLVKLSPP
ncbi:MAG: immunoglobulin domain-containing protein [Verrucomicrobiaceae bacterium]|nr:immunoglobulin domain-containing protein [Verrucomicrobiaceae bacterium]